jgi:hypothetical protein
MVASMFVA